MKRFFLYMFLLSGVTLTACRDDESYNVKPNPDETGNISLAVTGRIGTALGSNLTDYVKSLNLLVFKENTSGDYQLVRDVLLNKSDMSALEESADGIASGFTTPKAITFDTLSVGNYRIVGVGNIRDSLGNALPEVSLSRAQTGASMSQILAVVRNGDVAPRLFWGITDVITVGAEQPIPPVLKLYRKVAMFAFTVKDIPAVVDRIDMQIENISNSFNMLGTFPNIDAFALSSKNYTVEAGDSVTLTYVTLPTVTGQESGFTVTFYLQNGGKQVINLPQYVLKENTITKLTATIDVEQPGNIWKVDLNAVITVDTEWNIDQEPPIII